MMSEPRPAFYSVMAEGSIRLKTLLDHVHFKYASQGLRMEPGTGIGTLVLPPSTGEALTYVRYLVAELDDFARLCGRNHAEMSARLPAADLYRLYSLVGGQRDAARFVRGLRRDIASGQGLTLADLAARVSSPRLDQLLLYARLVAALQDGLGEGGMVGWEVTASEWDGMLSSHRLRSGEDSERLVGLYAGTQFRIDGGRSLRAYALMHEAHRGMEIWRKMVMDRADRLPHGDENDAKMLTMASYTLKYMVVDMARFARIYGTLGLEFRPDFMQRAEAYGAICGRHFAAHPGREELSTVGLLREEPGLLACACDDIWEAGVLLNRVHGTFAHRYLPPSSPLYGPDLERINRDYEAARASASGRRHESPGDGAGREIAAAMADALGGG
ncbi:MAG: hypothetical protein OXU25_03475 [Thaumarchaeota archaeon]|nr:hypothetical protein [Nitrososphaerota archaeon]